MSWGIPVWIQRWNPVTCFGFWKDSAAPINELFKRIVAWTGDRHLDECDVCNVYDCVLYIYIYTYIHIHIRLYEFQKLRYCSLSVEMKAVALLESLHD